jgi:3-hydroxyisobutyrate dehydrogenase-like beta-hydroxyacid dehydrogenase
MRIGFLGYGEAARAFHDGLARAVLAYDILLEGDDGGMAAVMKLHGASPATLAGLAEADWIFSAVTADQSFVAVEPLLPHLRQGQVLIDINSVSPGRKRETAAAVEAAGARYLDMAVMAPVQPKKHATPVLLAGECAAELLPDLLALGFSARVIGAEPGAATAIKMVRSLFVKGLEAITVETLLAAEASGCFEEIFVSLSTSFPGLDWSRFADYQFERTTRHGKRRAAEMDESAATLDGLGLHGALAREIAAVQAAMGAVRVMPQAGTGETVQQALRRRLGQV